jgi:hypothetical protein
MPLISSVEIFKKHMGSMLLGLSILTTWRQCKVSLKLRKKKRRRLFYKYRQGRENMPNMYI